MSNRPMMSGLFWFLAAATFIHAAEPERIAHWPLQENAIEAVGGTAPMEANAISYETIGPVGSQRRAARFDGEQSVIRVLSTPALKLGSEPFSISAWVYTDGSTTDVPGDIISQFNPATRTGLHLGL